MHKYILAFLIAGMLSGCSGNDSSSGPPLSSQSKQQIGHSRKASAAVASDYEQAVQALYVAYFGRPADPTGLTNFEAALLTAGAPTDIPGLANAYSTNPAVKALIDSFGTSKESKTLYASADSTAFVSAIFNNVLGRQPLAEGLNYWAGAIGNGSLTLGNAALSIMSGALQNTTAQGLLDAQLVNSRLTVAEDFTVTVANDGETTYYAGSAAAGAARTMLATVVASTDLTAFVSTVDTTVSSLVPVTTCLTNLQCSPTLVVTAPTGQLTHFAATAGQVDSTPSTISAPFALSDIYVNNFPTGVTSVSQTINLNVVTPKSDYAWFISLFVANKDGTTTQVYMQIQPEGIDANGVLTEGMVNFSYFGATSANPASGSASAAFSNEGVGYRTTHPLTVASGMSYVETITLTNGVLTGTITNAQTGAVIQIGSYPAPNIASIYGAGYSWEYWGYKAFGQWEAGDVTFGALTVNVAGYTSGDGMYITGNPTYNPKGLNYALEIGNCNEASTGGTASEVTLCGVFETITGSGTTTLTLSQAFSDLTSDSVSGIQTLDLAGNLAVMTPEQYKSFMLFVNTSGGLAIKLPGNMASYNIAKDASGGFNVSSSTMAATAFTQATKLVFADQTVSWPSN
jgi:hypothetical protein